MIGADWALERLAPLIRITSWSEADDDRRIRETLLHAPDKVAQVGRDAFNVHINDTHHHRHDDVQTLHSGARSRVMRDNPAIKIMLSEELGDNGRRQFVERAPSGYAKHVAFGASRRRSFDTRREDGGTRLVRILFSDVRC